MESTTTAIAGPCPSCRLMSLVTVDVYEAVVVVSGLQPAAGFPEPRRYVYCPNVACGYRWPPDVVSGLQPAAGFPEPRR